MSLKSASSAKSRLRSISSLCHYPQTLGAIKAKLLAKYPDASPAEGATDDVNHTLWMIEHVPALTEQGTIDRWVGWIGAKAHSMGLVDMGNDDIIESTALIEKDLHR